MLKIFNRKIYSKVFILSFLLLGFLSSSPSHAMDEEAPIRFYGRTLQSLSKDKKWYVIEQLIDTIKKELALKRLSMSCIINPQYAQWVEETPELFFFSECRLEESILTIPAKQLSHNGVYLTAQIDLYDPDELALVHAYLSVRDSLFLKKLDRCTSDDLESYLSILTLTPIGQRCFKNICLFPNLLFNEHVTKEELVPLRRAQKKLNFGKDRFNTFLCCAYELPNELIALLLHWIVEIM